MEWIICSACNLNRLDACDVLLMFESLDILILGAPQSGLLLSIEKVSHFVNFLKCYALWRWIRAKRGCKLLFQMLPRLAWHNWCVLPPCHRSRDFFSLAFLFNPRHYNYQCFEKNTWSLLWLVCNISLNIWMNKFYYIYYVY